MAERCFEDCPRLKLMDRASEESNFFDTLHNNRVIWNLVIHDQGALAENCPGPLEKTTILISSLAFSGIRKAFGMKAVGQSTFTSYRCRAQGFPEQIVEE